MTINIKQHLMVIGCTVKSSIEEGNVNNYEVDYPPYLGDINVSVNSKGIIYVKKILIKRFMKDNYHWFQNDPDFLGNIEFEDNFDNNFYKVLYKKNYVINYNDKIIKDHDLSKQLEGLLRHFQSEYKRISKRIKNIKNLYEELSSNEENILSEYTEPLTLLPNEKSKLIPNPFLDKIVKSLNEDLPLFLIGPTGSGKKTLMLQYSDKTSTHIRVWKPENSVRRYEGLSALVYHFDELLPIIRKSGTYLFFPFTHLISMENPDWSGFNTIADYFAYQRYTNKIIFSIDKNLGFPFIKKSFLIHQSNSVELEYNSDFIKLVIAKQLNIPATSKKVSDIVEEASSISFLNSPHREIRFCKHLDKNEITEESLKAITSKINESLEPLFSAVINKKTNADNKIVKSDLFLKEQVKENINSLKDIISTGESLFLYGPPESGKTTLIKVAIEELNKKIVSVNSVDMIANTKYRGQFADKWNQLEKQVPKNGVLLIENIIHIINMGKTLEGEAEAIVHFISSYLDRGGQIIMMGLPSQLRHFEQTSSDLYAKVTKKEFEAYNTFTLIKILNHKLNLLLIDKFETKNTISRETKDILSQLISDDKSIKRLIELIRLFGKEKKHSIKLIIKFINHIIDSIISKKLTNLDNLDSLIDDSRHEILRIPKKEVLFSKLKTLEKEIKKTVIGQDKAINTISNHIKSEVLYNKPVFFMLAGPTGVGKTYSAKEISNHFNIWNEDSQLIKLDMSEYQDSMSINKLIGTSPGYAGYNESTKTSPLLRVKPFSVLLLDEIEKSHPDFWHLFLQLMDDGKLKLSDGYEIDFTNVFIFATTNMGTKEIKNISGFSSEDTEDERQSQTIKQAIKRYLPPEVMGRIQDGIVIFNSLTKSSYKKIITIELNKLLDALMDFHGINITIEKSVIDFILNEISSDMGYGARYLTQKIKKIVITPLSDEIINTFPNKKEFNIKIKGNKLSF